MHGLTLPCQYFSYGEGGNIAGNEFNGVCMGCPESATVLLEYAVGFNTFEMLDELVCSKWSTTGWHMDT